MNPDPGLGLNLDPTIKKALIWGPTLFKKLDPDPRKMLGSGSTPQIKSVVFERVSQPSPVISSRLSLSLFAQIVYFQNIGSIM